MRQVARSMHHGPEVVADILKVDKQKRAVLEPQNVALLHVVVAEAQVSRDGLRDSVHHGVHGRAYREQPMQPAILLCEVE
jgi:hypothetical protein